MTHCSVMKWCRARYEARPLHANHLALGAFGELPKLPVDVVVGAGVPVGVNEVTQQVKTIM